MDEKYHVRFTYGAIFAVNFLEQKSSGANKGRDSVMTIKALCPICLKFQANTLENLEGKHARSN
jgi:hypothetical protein